MSYRLMLALVAMLLMSVTPANATGTSTNNILVNPKFSQGMPTGWTTDSYRPGAHFDWRQSWRRLAIHIPQDTANDARWIQRVAVRPHTRYRLSGWIRVRGVTPTIDTLDVGGNLSVLESLPERGAFTHTEPLLGTRGWTYRQVTFDSGDRDWITIALRLGMYSGQTTGKAWFRWVQLTEVE